MSEKLKLDNKVIVSDPCYGLNTWCQGVLNNVKKGEYIPSIRREYDSVAEIMVVHSEYQETELDFKKEPFSVGVDSGQAGIFDYSYYEKYHKSSKENEHVDRNWYDRVCELGYQYKANPNYIPFSSTLELQGIIAEFTRELFKYNDTVKEINVSEIVLDTLSQYTKDRDSSVNLNYDEVINKLNSLIELLENKTLEQAELSEEEAKLKEIKQKYRSMACERYIEYQNSPKARKGMMERTADIIDGQGFCGSTYDGDGMFECHTAKNNDGEIVAIKVIYDNYCDDDEDYDE